MNQNHQPTLRIHGPVDLLSAVPYLLGFHPAESLVLVGPSHGVLVVTARLDLADALAQEVLIAETLEAMVRGGSTQFVAAIFTDNPPATEQRRPHADLAVTLGALIDKAGGTLLDALLVTNNVWSSYLCADPQCCPAAGRPLPAAPTPFATAATAEGLTAAPSRHDLELRFEPDQDRRLPAELVRQAERGLRFAGAVLHGDGISTPRIIGIPLDGRGTARIPDTDHGRLDRDPIYDHAVGPMQFIPATWALYGVDGNNDHRIDPFNIFDAALTAADYLCAASGGTLTTLRGQTRAVLTYNHSDAYLVLVLQLERLYAQGLSGLTIPIIPNSGAAHAAPRPGIPAADPGAAPGDSISPATGRSTARAPRTQTNQPTSASAPRPIPTPPIRTTGSATCPATTSAAAPPTPSGPNPTATATQQTSSTVPTAGAPIGSATDSTSPVATASHARCP